MRGSESSTNSVVSPIDRIECFRKDELIFTASGSEISAFPELNRGGVMTCSGVGFDARIVEASILSLGTGRTHHQHHPLKPYSVCTVTEEDPCIME